MTSNDMPSTELQTETKFTESEMMAIKEYAQALIDDNLISNLERPKNTNDWRRALLVPTLGKVFEGTDGLESYYAITQRAMPEIPAGDSSSVSAVTFMDDNDNKFLLTDSTVSDPSTEVPEEYTFYQL